MKMTNRTMIHWLWESPRRPKRWVTLWGRVTHSGIHAVKGLRSRLHREYLSILKKHRQARMQTDWRIRWGMATETVPTAVKRGSFQPFPLKHGWKTLGMSLAPCFRRHLTELTHRNHLFSWESVKLSWEQSSMVETLPRIHPSPGFYP